MNVLEYMPIRDYIFNRYSVTCRVLPFCLWIYFKEHVIVGSKHADVWGCYCFISVSDVVAFLFIVFIIFLSKLKKSHSVGFLLSLGYVMACFVNSPLFC